MRVFFHALAAALWIFAVSFLTTAPCLAAPSAPPSLDQRLMFDIPAQPLSSALLAFGERTGFSVLTPQSLLADQRSAALSGRHTVRQALEILLSSTPLGFRLVNERTLTLMAHKPPARKPRRTAPAAPAAPAAKPAAGKLVIDAVTVTARLREENLQRIPLAVSALDAVTIEQADITGLKDIGTRVPGLTFASFSLGQPTIHLRGIGSNDDGASLSNSIVMLVDDVYVGRFSVIDADLFDVERIEVLRGPQGTLYGNNAIGGAIRVTTGKPTETPEASARASLGNLNRRDFSGHLAGPLIEDRLLARISFNQRRRDGFQTNLLTGAKQQDENTRSGRAQVLLRVGEDGEVLLSADTSRTRLGGTGRVAVAGPNEPAFSRNSPGPRFALNDFAGFTRRNVEGYMARTTWDVGGPNLTTITAWRQSRFGWGEDSTGLNPSIGPAQGRGGGGEIDDVVATHIRQFSQEMRLASPEDQPLTWLIGLYYLRERVNRREDFPFIGFTKTTAQNALNQSFAVFGQTSLALTGRLNLALGARYTHERKKLDQFTASTGGPPFIIAQVFQSKSHKGFDNLAPKITLDYTLSEDVMLFASATRGFKGGGFQGAPGTPADARRVLAGEKVDSYETGLKSQLLHNRLQFNATAFLSNFKDLQVAQFQPNPATGFGNFITSNAQKARTRGVEIEVTAKPFSGLAISGYYAWLDARYRKFIDVRGRNFAGSHLRQAPKHSLGMATTWRIPLSVGALELRGDYRYQAKSFREPDNSIAILPAFGVWDASLAFDSPDDRWRLALWAKNLLDNEYISHLYNLGGTDYALFAPPRTYGLSLRWRYP